MLFLNINPFAAFSSITYQICFNYMVSIQTRLSQLENNIWRPWALRECVWKYIFHPHPLDGSAMLWAYTNETNWVSCRLHNGLAMRIGWLTPSSCSTQHKCTVHSFTCSANSGPSLPIVINIPWLRSCKSGWGAVGTLTMYSVTPVSWCMYKHHSGVQWKCEANLLLTTSTNDMSDTQDITYTSSLLSDTHCGCSDIVLMEFYYEPHIWYVMIFFLISDYTYLMCYTECEFMVHVWKKSL